MKINCETRNLPMCAKISTSTKKKCKIPYSPRTCPIAEHPTHHGPAPSQNTLLAMDVLPRRTPYSLWTWPTAERPTHRGPVPHWNTLLTVDFPHPTTPDSPWTFPTWNTLLTQRKKTFRRNCTFWHDNTQQIDIATYILNWPCHPKSSLI